MHPTRIKRTNDIVIPGRFTDNMLDNVAGGMRDENGKYFSISHNITGFVEKERLGVFMVDIRRFSMKSFGTLMICLAALCLLPISGLVVAQTSQDAKRVIIAGAGPSTQVVELLAQEFCAEHNDYTIVVPSKSIKHRGGLEWVMKPTMLFGRTGRPLSHEDRNAFPHVIELPLARLKTAFAVRKDLGVTALTLEQWTHIYMGTIRNWKDVGGSDKPIILLGRAKGESVFTAIASAYPFFETAEFQKIYDKEHQMVKAITRVPGALGFSSQSVLAAEEDLTILSIDHFSAGLRVALVYHEKHKDVETVRMMISFIQSDRWRQALETHDFLPVNTD